jgi:UDP-hydrolysing UDP-N-acetyl-D-glucosamine 2-epimerase
MRLGLLTTGRQDWGILRSTYRALMAESQFEVAVLAGGMHASARYGRTVSLLEEDGCTPTELLEWIPEKGDDDSFSAAGSAVREVGYALRRRAVEALLLVGDRYETAAAALAATLGRVPLVHLHGGEETEGAFDNVLRHAVTKLSHLHLVSHSIHARRVAALGEDPQTVHVVGAPGLDNLHRADLPNRSELEQFLGLRLGEPLVIVTIHPATLAGNPTREVEALVQAMRRIPATYVATLPNSDPGSSEIRELLKVSVENQGGVAVEALGERRFWGLLRIADAIVGNSSSALIEAPVVQLPAVNIGDRQKGRLRGTNVIDAGGDADAIERAINTALSREFRASLAGSTSLYGDGLSAERIVRILKSWRPPNPLVKAAVGVGP